MGREGAKRQACKNRRMQKRQALPLTQTHSAASISRAMLLRHAPQASNGPVRLPLQCKCISPPQEYHTDEPRADVSTKSRSKQMRDDHAYSVASIYRIMLIQG